MLSFDRLDREVQRWIRNQGWTALRPVQNRAIEAIFSDRRDVLIAAATAAGKTEAALLPLLSSIAGRRDPGVALLYVAPLKALINDQHKRLVELCDRLDIPVVRWHGDAPQGPKTNLLRSPRGLVLITPESIEAMFLRRPGTVELLFGSLDAIVIDELHAFLQGPRGLHLWSLLNRIDRLNAPRPRRVGLSATLGDLDQACRWLSGANDQPPHRIVVEGGGAELRLQVRAYVDPPEAEAMSARFDDDGEETALARICDHAFGALRGRNNLFFAGSRARVEEIADRLRRRAETEKLPNEFYPHHGSLSKDLREEVEVRLKEGRLPTTAIATTTLELGIDIGSVHTVAQYGAPRSLSSLRQRLGRSGRRAGTPAIFRNYLREDWIDPDSDPLDRLHLPVVQSVAALSLLAEHFVEPPRAEGALLSVALHQILSLIVERGALPAAALYAAFRPAGPFDTVGPADFADLLRGMARSEPALIEQAPDGSIMLGPLGERLTSSRDFYANFASDEEWRIVHRDKTLGTLPIVNALAIGSIISFAGRRWRAIGVDDRAKLVEVEPHRARRIPKFERASGEPVHDRLARKMREVLEETAVPGYLDPVATALLADARRAHENYGLATGRFLPAGKNCHVMTWRGSETNMMLAVLLTATGFQCETFDVGVTLEGAPADEARDVIAALGACPPIEELGRHVRNLIGEKYDALVPEALLRTFWVRRHAHLADEVTALIAELAP